MWLEDVGYIELDDKTALLGHGCWGDGRAGSYRRSELFLSDFSLIHDYRGKGKLERLRMMHKLGDESGAYLKRWCSVAAKKFRRIFILTHVPLFPEATLYQGRQDPMGQPFFCCAGAGFDLIEVAENYPHVQFTALSGHTHDPAEAQISDNLRAMVMGAEYGEPKWQIIEV